MNKRHKKILTYTSFLIAACALVVGFIVVIRLHDIPQAIRIIGGSFFVLLVPGFFTSFIFFPEHVTLVTEIRQEKQRRLALDAIERLVLSILLSMVMSSLAVYVIYAIPGLGFPFNMRGFANSILGVTVVVLVIAILRIVWRNRKRDV